MSRLPAASCRASLRRASRPKATLLLCCAGLLLSGCNILGGAGSKNEQADPAGTQQMVNLLALTTAEIDPREYFYQNDLRIAYMERIPLPPAGNARLRYETELALELLRDGRTEEAIERYRPLLAEYSPMIKGDSADAREARYYFEDAMAISQLRLGEQENCLINHSIDSCLLPIEGSGVHQLERGSRAAVEAYTHILKERPEDMTARWLINIAYMTLGEWPDQVPPDWLIPPEVFASDFPLPRFRDVAGPAGVAVIDQAGGVAMEDFDGDGRLDLMASSWGLDDPLRLFINLGDGHFEERTEEAGLSGLNGGLNLVHADYDNDGDADVLVLRGAWSNAMGRQPNSLLANQGDGRFVDVTRDAGLLALKPSQTAAWADYDGDGWLDLFIGNESGTIHHVSELYHNEQDGTFRELGRATGLAVDAFVKGAVWGDYDNDGRPDLYLSILGAANRLYRNEGPGEGGDGEVGADGGSGAWLFRDVAAEAGVTEPEFSFPAWFWDYDNDGWLDLFVSGYRFSLESGNIEMVAADYLGQAPDIAHPRLYRNRGDGSFEDRTEEADLNRVLYTMGSNYGDLDNDGWLDCYLGTGEPDYKGLMPNRMFRQDGAGRFQDVTTAGGFGSIQKGHGIAFGDLDADGDQDIYAVMGGAFTGDVYQNILFENPGDWGNHWITLRLEGRQANRSAIGARLQLDLEGPEGPRSIHHVVGTGGSFGSQSLQAELGLGKADRITRLRVTWPGSGAVQDFEGLAVDGVYRIVEGEAEPEAVELPAFRFPQEMEMQMDAGGGSGGMPIPPPPIH